MIEIFIDAPMELKVIILGSIFFILKEILTERSNGKNKDNMDN
tara:strand:+ start:683 stop:811 length:129 start_codon:yes stop_codon:yes gene_type:complete